MTVRFAVPGQPVGKNSSKGLNWNRKTFFVPTETKRWMRRVAVAGHAAAVASDWPGDPFMVKLCAYRIHRYNVRGDADRGDTYAIDALQFTRWPTPRGEAPLPGPIGLFGNDRDAFCDGSYPSVADAGGPRIELELTLRALRSPAEADALRRRFYEAEIRRAAKKAKQRKPARGDVRESAAVKRRRDEIAQIEQNLGIRLPLGDV